MPLKFRYTTFQILVLVTLVAAFLAFLALPWHRRWTEEQLVSQVTKLGGVVATQQNGNLVILLGEPCPLVNNAVIPSPGSRGVSDNELSIFAETEWADMPVTALSLNGTAITDKGIPQLRTLRKLKILSLENTAIGDAALELIRDFKSLRFVNVENTHVTAEGIAEFRRERPEVEIIGVVPVVVPVRPENSIR